MYSKHVIGIYTAVHLLVDFGQCVQADPTCHAVVYCPWFLSVTVEIGWSVVVDLLELGEELGRGALRCAVSEVEDW